MIKRNSNEQKAMEYVVYMMVGSYFKKSSCISKWMEGRAFIEYKEMNVNKQLVMEEMSINFVEKVLLKELPQDVWQKEMRVKFNSYEDGSSEIRFTGGEYLIRIFTLYKGKKTEFEYRIYKK